MSKISAVITFVIGMFFGFSAAAEGLMTDSLNTNRLKEVEVDGHRRAEYRSALPIQRLNEQELSTLTANSVGDAAKHLAGVNVKDYGGVGGLKTVSIRGLGALHTGVSYDGVMMSDVQTGQIDLGKFTLENVSEISIANGQPNDFFQPARMFASSGLLSFSTQPPKYDSANKFQGKITAKAGSFGLLNPSVYISKYLHPKFAVTASCNALTANGKYDYIENNNQGNHKIRTNSDVQSIRTEANAYYKLQEFENLSFKINHSYSERGLPGPNILYSTFSTDRLRDQNYLAQLHYVNKQSCYVQYQLQGKVNTAHTVFSTYDTKYSGDHWLRDDYLQNEYYLSGTAQYYPTKNLSLVAAGDWWYNDLYTHTTNVSYRIDEKPTRNTILGNIAAKYVNEHITIGMNLLLTSTLEKSIKNETPNHQKISPTASISVKILNNEELRLRAFHKNIFRLPTFTDLYYHNFGYSKLQPETTDQYNLGITYYTSHLPGGSELDCSVDAYYNRVSDKITVKYGMPFSSVRNIGRVEIKGLDAQLGLKLNFSRSYTFSIKGNYTYQNATDCTTNSENFGEQIAYTPTHSGSATVTLKNRHFECGYNLLYSGKRWDGPNIRSNKLEAYADQSIFGSTTLFRMKFTGELMNIFNQQYDIIKDYPMPGRNYKLTIGYSF